jgi:hypothetical protein
MSHVKPKKEPTKSRGFSVWTAEPRVGFPFTVRIGWLFKRFVPFGWEDLGEISWIEQIDKNGKDFLQQDIHEICGDPLHAGKERDVVFRFCKRCKVKVACKEEKTQEK